MVTLLLEIARNILFLFFSLRPRPNLEKLHKFFQWRGLPHTSLLRLFMLLLVLNFVPQLLQSNRWPLRCQIFSLLVLART